MDAELLERRGEYAGHRTERDAGDANRRNAITARRERPEAE
jgi:hypothetical protein